MTDPTEQPRALRALAPIIGSLDDPRSRTVRGGRIAALAFLTAGLVAIPANLLIEPSQIFVYAMPALALTPGVACLFLPWQRMPEWTLQIAALLGVALISVAMAVVSPAYAVFYIFVALFIALVMPGVRAVVDHWLLITVGLFVPVVVGENQGRETLIVAILTAPTLLVVTGITAYLTARLESSKAALWDLARQDALTGVGNYRALHEHLEAEIARHSRSGREFALILLDLDSFKVVNERFGHLGGDRVLAEVGRTLREAIRRGDAVYRQGGDEFSVVAPESGLAAAHEVAARLRIRVRECGLADQRVSATTGIAVYPSDGLTVDDLLGQADVQVLEAKREADGARGGQAV
ncbi:MAG: GGDEF domain-containing protein [Solirubrobacterales bacterium]